MTTKIKQKMLSGKPIIGTWMTLGSPLVAEVLTHCNLDFLIIDMEHGPFDISRVSNFINACRGSSTLAIVRIPANQSWMALQCLDQGAQALMVPHIGTRNDADQVIKSMYYYPKGDRGYSPYTKGGAFGSTDNYALKANDCLLSVGIVESQSGINNLEDIFDSKMDIFYFGAYDLSQSLGIPGDTTDPKILDQVKKGIALAERRNLYVGAYVAKNADDIKWQIDLGLKFITYQIDSSILKSHYLSIAEKFSTMF